MAYYCGIDLAAKNSQLCVIDQDCDVLFNRKVSNRADLILENLEAFMPDLHCVVEATFNWYWLVDALQAASVDVKLAHSLKLHMISKAKVKTDRRDAEMLARLLRIGEIPEAYIYPRESRPIRELVRRRGRLVQMRSRELMAIRRQLYQEGILEHSARKVRNADPEDLARWFQDPRVRRIAHQEIDRIALFSKQIEKLEEEIHRAAKKDSDFLRLCQLPGVGQILAAVIFYETGSIDRFPSGKNYSSYCRVVPGVASSANVRRRGRGSKQGNAQLK